MAISCTSIRVHLHSSVSLDSSSRPQAGGPQAIETAAVFVIFRRVLRIVVFVVMAVITVQMTTTRARPARP
jgi:hypothetical protein